MCLSSAHCLWQVVVTLYQILDQHSSAFLWLVKLSICKSRIGQFSPHQPDHMSPCVFMLWELTTLVSCPLSVRLVLSVVTAISRYFKYFYIFDEAIVFFTREEINVETKFSSSSPVTVSLCSPQSASRASWSSPVCPPSPRFSPLVLTPPPALTSHSADPHPLELELLPQLTLLWVLVTIAICIDENIISRPCKPTLLPRLLWRPSRPRAPALWDLQETLDPLVCADPAAVWPLEDKW